MLDLDSCRAKQQRADEHLKANRYRDFNLVFCKELDCYEPGLPLLLNNIGQREYRKLVKAAKVKTIRFHGLRHTAATLLLQKGEPVENVSKMLGHSRVSMTSPPPYKFSRRCRSR
jgi:integrase